MPLVYVRSTSTFRDRVSTPAAVSGGVLEWKPTRDQSELGLVVLRIQVQWQKEVERRATNNIDSGHVRVLWKVPDIQ